MIGREKTLKEGEWAVARHMTIAGYNAVDHKHYEGAFTQGNGYMNIRASFEEDLHEASQNDRYWRLPANVTLEKARHPKSKWGVYIPGIYGMHPILGEEIVNLPYPLGLNLYHAEERLDMELSRYSELQRSLDMDYGELTRSLVWHREGHDLQVKYRRYCSMANKHLVVQHFCITSTADTEIVLESFMDGDVTTNGYQHFTMVEGEASQGLLLTVKTDTDQEVAMFSRMEGESLGTPEYHALDETNRIRATYRIPLRQGESVKLIKYVWMATSVDADFARTGDIAGHLIQIADRGVDPATDWEAHKREWDAKWRQSGIMIEGDSKLQESVNFSIYHLLRSVNESDRVAIDAKAYAGEAYFGHYFWDTEIYLLPFYIYTQPQYAKKLIAYRYNTLQGARANAARYGYEGARYPWESCISGLEQCSNWQYADLEIHVTADVIYGLYHYYEATQDEQFMLNEGLEMLVETARYWVSRVDRKGDSYHLMGVMGPDEYLPFTDNNAFTNYMVKFALQTTLSMLERAESVNPELTARLKVTEQERKMFLDVAEHLVFPDIEKARFILQCDRFDEFLDVDFDAVWLDRSKPFGHFISQERNYRSKALKQADVIALLYLFRERFDQETMQNCLDYYKGMTTHDSSLSYIFHSLMYTEVGDMEEGYSYLQKSLDIDLDSKGAAEGIHIANCGGIWQAVVMGIGGFRGVIDQPELAIKPKLPAHVTGLKYSICVRGIWYEVKVDRHGVYIQESTTTGGEII